MQTSTNASYIIAAERVHQIKEEDGGMVKLSCWSSDVYIDVFGCFFILFFTSYSILILCETNFFN